jgi:hypothetical protein
MMVLIAGALRDDVSCWQCARKRGLPVEEDSSSPTCSNSGTHRRRSRVSDLKKVGLSGTHLITLAAPSFCGSRHRPCTDGLAQRTSAGDVRLHALVDPTMRARLADLGGTPLPGSPAQFGKLIAEETEKLGRVIRAANIKPQG